MNKAPPQTPEAKWAETSTSKPSNIKETKMYAMNESNSQSSTVIPATTKKRRISTADKLNTMRAMILAGKYMERPMHSKNEITY